MSKRVVKFGRSAPGAAFDAVWSLCYITLGRREKTPLFLLYWRRRITKELRINDRIRAREVRVIDDQGEQLGIIPLLQALQLAKEKNLDLVEVAPTAVPPVCRLLDFGKYKYEQTKKEREAKKHQKVVLLKEIRMRLKIDEHDIQFKTRNIEKFLKDGDKVKVTVIFRGRELSHFQLGKELLEKVVSPLRAVAIIEKAPLMEGRNLSVILAPRPEGRKVEGAPRADGAAAAQSAATPSSQPQSQSPTQVNA